MTQGDLADAVRLSAVHTNRSLQRLREDRLIRTYGKPVEIEDRPRLSQIAGFDSTYLHLEGPRQISDV